MSFSIFRALGCTLAILIIGFCIPGFNGSFNHYVVVMGVSLGLGWVGGL